MKPIFFSSPEAFREWLEKNHAREKEVWVGYWKVGTGKPSLTWSQSVDQALCYGWIDGVRHSVDEERYCMRFTPRKPRSNWSDINIRKVAALKKAGLMRPAGLAAFEARDPARTRTYSFEREQSKLSPAYVREFRANAKAWEDFQRRSPSYRKTVTHWVMSAKQEATRRRRLATLIADCARGQRIAGMRPGKP